MQTTQSRKLWWRHLTFDVKYNSTKSNVMVFCCNLLKDIPVHNFMLNGVPIDKVSNC